MEDGGDCLMTDKKNQLVGWWRARKKKDQTIVATERAVIYAFLLIVMIFPLGPEFGTPSFEDFFDIIKQCSFFQDFCTMFGYYMILGYGSVMNLSVRQKIY